MSSETARSIGGLGNLAACPQLEREPRTGGFVTTVTAGGDKVVDKA